MSLQGIIKEKIGEPEAAEIVFWLNGEQVCLRAAEVDPTKTLNEYIRRDTLFRGTKLSCGEGGCGACIVTLQKFSADGTIETSAANSCLRPLILCDGYSITTIEGIGGSEHKEGYHPIQERFSALHATQCGYCTPGMVMTLYSSLQRDGDLNMEELENRFDGNICRCTGYRPILDAAKSFGSDTNIKDHITATELNRGYDHSRDPIPDEGTKDYLYGSAIFEGTGQTYIRLTSAQQAFHVLNQFPSEEVRIIVGGTSIGIYKEDIPIPIVVDISKIPELHGIELSEAGLSIGAAESITTLYKTLRSAQDVNSSWKPLADHVLRVASWSIRDCGSIGGNLVMAKTKGFLSDLATIFLAHSIEVTLQIGSRTRRISLEEFLNRPSLDTGVLLGAIHIPSTKANQQFFSYKGALRNTFAHAFVNAAFTACMDDEKKGLSDVRIAYGGIRPDDEPGSHAILAKNVQTYLEGRSLDRETLEGALTLLEQEIQPVETNALAAYRASLVVSFFYKFFLELLGESPAIVASATANNNPYLRGVTTGFQEFKYAEDEISPISKPVKKFESLRQSAGNTLYTADMREIEGTLFVAFVQTTRAGVKIKSVDPAEALDSIGVVAYYDKDDVPKNNCSHMGQDIPVFADGFSKFAGQPIGMIVADSVKHAEIGAAKVIVEYDDEEEKGLAGAFYLDQILDDEKNSQRQVSVNEHKTADDVEDALKADKHYISEWISMSSQKHFFMEPYAHYIVPDEDSRLVLYTGTQWPDGISSGVCQSLEIPINQLKVVARRVGGAFGGKCVQNIPSAIAGAIAAMKLNRPIKVTMNRNFEFNAVGGRIEFGAQIEAAFDNEGKISAARINGHALCGFQPGLAWFTAISIANAMNQAYHFEKYAVASHLHVGDLPERGVVRGPGEIQASVAIENLIELVANKVNLPAEIVRERNFYPRDIGDISSVSGTKLEPSFALYNVWDSAKAQSEFDRRQTAIADFNTQNRYRKRGISMTPVRYEVHVLPRAAVVNIYGDGTVIVHHSGCEMGQGLNTKVAQMVAHEFGKLGCEVSMDLIKFADYDSFVLPNAIFTGGSTGSEGAAIAAQRCCEKLNESLSMILAGLKSAAEEKEEEFVLDWRTLCGAAKLQGMQLSAHAAWLGGGPDKLAYMCWGVGVSEVEIDILTGETEILRTDIHYDAGKSLNPAIDVGQAEGAFMMGVGLILQEKVDYDRETGKVLDDTTWTYKPPLSKNVPKEFNIHLAQGPFKDGILSSKASGEPPLVLATSVLMAMRQAIASAREDHGLLEDFVMNTPCTPAKVVELVGVSSADLVQSLE